MNINLIYLFFGIFFGIQIGFAIRPIFYLFFGRDIVLLKRKIRKQLEI